MIRTLLTLAVAVMATTAASAQNIRAGIIGLDTSHVLSFTKTLNTDPQ